MTPKEKAKELISKFEVWTSRNINAGYSEYDAKQCALIAVDEMIYENNLHLSFFGRERIQWLLEVKQEIEKL